jgi:hypothetical protein
MPDSIVSDNPSDKPSIAMNIILLTNSFIQLRQKYRNCSIIEIKFVVKKTLYNSLLNL